MNRITLTTKFFTPLLREDYVARPRLLSQIKANFQQNLILISAPAGFGKTTLLSEWVRANKNPHTQRYAWLSLDNKDNAPFRFWGYVIHALQTVQPGLGKAALARLENLDPAPIEELLIVLLNEIAWLKVPVPPEVIAWAAQDVGASVKPMTPEEWIGLLDKAGLKEIVAKIHAVDIQDDAKGILRRYGWGGMLRIMGRTLGLYTKSPSYRDFVKRVRQGGIVPDNLNEYFGYGLFIGRKD